MSLREQVGEIVHQHADFRTDSDALTDGIMRILPTPEGVTRALARNGYDVPVSALAAAMKRGDA